MSALVTILIIVLVLAICLYIFYRFVMPIIPAPWGQIILAIVAIIVIVYLLQRFVGL
jgi:hypothetical protein